MPESHLQGPNVSYGYNPTTGGDYNPDAGPDTNYQGDCWFDPRYPYAGGGGPAGQSGGADLPVTRASFFNTQSLRAVDAIPATLTTGAIAAAQAPATGTPMTLVSSSGAGIVVTTLAAAAANYLMQGTAPGLRASAVALGGSTTILAVQSLWTPLQVGRNQLHDPTTAITRAVSLTASATLSGINFVVRGYDLYGYKMTETIAGPASATTVFGKKAWKYILSVTPSGTSASTAAIGLSDIYGLGIRCDKWEDLLPFWAGLFVSAASTGFTAADTTSPATATTGDVRGTYAVQSASNGTNRLSLIHNPPVALMTTATFINPAPLVGVSQFSDF